MDWGGASEDIFANENDFSSSELGVNRSVVVVYIAPVSF